jgi:hypothetical protein
MIRDTRKNRIAPLVAMAVALAMVLGPLAYAASSSSLKTQDRSPGAPVAMAISTVTGIAISPLLGTGAYGAAKWFMANDEAERAKLPWYAQPHFWLPALIIVGLVGLKDALGAGVPTGLKRPLDVLETLENQLSGLVAAGAVIPLVIASISEMILRGDVAGVESGIVSSGLAAIWFGSIDTTWLLNLLLMPLGIAVFLLVWLASHAINVLILLSPWGAIDAALKAGRTALLGLVAGTAIISPMWGAVLSLIVIIVSYFVAGWAFRLTVFGAVYSWDFLTRRCVRFVPEPGENRVFSGANFSGVPVRSYGRLVLRGDGILEFVYKPWLVLKKRIAQVPADTRSLAVGKGLLISTVISADDRTLFLLPPRYRGHEEAVVQAYGMGGGVRDAGLRRAWGALREMIGGRAVKPPEPASV